MGGCNCCLPKSNSDGENALLRDGNRAVGKGGRYGQPGDRIVIDAGYLEEDLSNPVEQTWVADIHACWAQKPSSLAIHTDLPRLVRKCTIIDSKGKDVTPAFGIPPIVLMKAGQEVPPAIGEDSRMREDEIIVLNFLLTLSKALNDEFTYKHLEERFWDFFPYVPMV